jgi:hypothetical protein
MTPPSTCPRSKRLREDASSDTTPLKRTKLGANNIQYQCDQTGDDHMDNQLDFSTLVDVSSQVAQVLQHLSSDYHLTWTPYTPDLAEATRLLKKDITKYSHRASRGTAYCNTTDPVKRNTVLRALILFSLGGIHATQYIEHEAGDRVAWIIQLNTSGVWIKPKWERDMATRMIHELRRRSVDFVKICKPEYVYYTVFNSYFLMLFARRNSMDLKREMDLMGEKCFSWYDLLVLRRSFFERECKLESDYSLAEDIVV